MLLPSCCCPLLHWLVYQQHMACGCHQPCLQQQLLLLQLPERHQHQTLAACTQPCFQLLLQQQLDEQSSQACGAAAA
jgi:hypothetical protein